MSILPSHMPIPFPLIAPTLGPLEEPTKADSDKASVDLESSTTLVMDSRETGPQATTEALPTNFLPPPSPFEGRRGSLASSFTSSDYTDCNDYSMPVTPTQIRSPMEQDRVAKAIPYNIHQPMTCLPLLSPQEHISNGNPYDAFDVIPVGPRSLPLLSASKEFATSDHLYDSWMMVSTPPAVPFHQQALPTSGPTPHHHHQPLNEHSIGFDNMPSAESSWDNLSMHVWADTSRGTYYDLDFSRRLDQIPPPRPEEFPTSWSPTIGSSFSNVSGMNPTTIMPSDAMMEDYVMVSPAGYDHDSPMDNVNPSVVQSPQEVEYQRADTPEVKREPSVDSGPSRMENRMYIRSTGAKGVKKEPKTSGVSKRKKKANSPKYREYKVKHRSGDQLFVKFEEGLVEDEVTGKLRRVNGNRAKNFVCNYCNKGFERQEHWKRHERIHKDKKPVAVCCVCRVASNVIKPFDRNDNFIAHIVNTHILQPEKGKGRPRNARLGVMEVLALLRSPDGHQNDPKTIARHNQLIEKLERKYNTVHVTV